MLSGSLLVLLLLLLLLLLLAILQERTDRNFQQLMAEIYEACVQQVRRDQQQRYMTSRGCLYILSNLDPSRSPMCSS
jgi:hypothetical protein